MRKAIRLRRRVDFIELTLTAEQNVILEKEHFGKFKNKFRNTSLQQKTSNLSQ